MGNFPKRKEIRLKEYDYSQNGRYFVTVCTEKRKNILCSGFENSVGDGFPVPELTWIGQMVDKYINEISIKYTAVTVDKYAIMPNHIHLLLTINYKGTGNPSPTLGNVIGWFKYNSTKAINNSADNNGNKIWQRSYYDHIIRNEADYLEKYNYIRTNPLKWSEDEYYI